MRRLRVFTDNRRGGRFSPVLRIPPAAAGVRGPGAWRRGRLRREKNREGEWVHLGGWMGAAGKRRRPFPTGPLFRTPTGEPWERSGSGDARNSLYSILERAQINRIGSAERTIDLHALRGTAATRMRRHKVPLEVVARILGHQDVSITMRHYEDLRLADTEAAVAQVPDLEAALDDAQQTKENAEPGSNLATGADDTPPKRKRRRPQVMPTTPLPDGTPVGSRTPNLLIRSQVLYPVELRAPSYDGDCSRGGARFKGRSAAVGALSDVSRVCGFQGLRVGCRGLRGGTGAGPCGRRGGCGG